MKKESQINYYREFETFYQIEAVHVTNAQEKPLKLHQIKTKMTINTFNEKIITDVMQNIPRLIRDG